MRVGNHDRAPHPAETKPGGARKSRGHLGLAVVAVAGTLLLFGALVMWPIVKLPLALHRAHGMAPEDVRRRCGAPDKEWQTPALLGCHGGYCPQRRDLARGRVWFYVRLGIGWFAYFDEHDRLHATEVNTS